MISGIVDPKPVLQECRNSMYELQTVFCGVGIRQTRIWKLLLFLLSVIMQLFYFITHDSSLSNVFPSHQNHHHSWRLSYRLQITTGLFVLHYRSMQKVQYQQDKLESQLGKNAHYNSPPFLNELTGLVFHNHNRDQTYC